MFEPSETFPPYLDPGSVGAAVTYAQNAILARKRDLPNCIYNTKLTTTGWHTGEWVTAIQAWQQELGIEADGGMGPEFRTTIKERYKINLIWNTSTQIKRLRPTGCTLWRGPDSQYLQLIMHDIVNDSLKVDSVHFVPFVSYQASGQEVSISSIARETAHLALRMAGEEDPIIAFGSERHLPNERQRWCVELGLSPGRLLLVSWRGQVAEPVPLGTLAYLINLLGPSIVVTDRLST